MPNYNLNKAAKRMEKDYQYMQVHSPQMNQPITEQNREIGYVAAQGLKDAAHDAQKQFAIRERAHENVFLWKDQKDTWTKTAKYTEFANKNNQEVQDYSERYTNHSARKRAGSSSEAAKQYETYNSRMLQLSNMAEEIDALTNVNSPEAIKEIKKFFKESLAVLDIREKAMRASAEVKSTSEADEAYRKAKIRRLILSQKVSLARKYSEKYNETRETRVLGEYFQQQFEKLNVELVKYHHDYKKAYIAARGSVDHIMLEELAPANEQAGNQAFDVKNDVESENISTKNYKKKFGQPGTNDFRNKLREGQNNIAVNSSLSSVRDALNKISHDQGDKYSEQLNKITNLGSGYGNVTLKRHMRKGHSYSQNNEIVYRFDLLGTSDSVNYTVKEKKDVIEILTDSLSHPNISDYQKNLLKVYFKWLKEVKHHPSMDNIDLNDANIFSQEFRQSQFQVAKRSKNKLVADYYSYTVFGKNNDSEEIGHANRGIRVREAERNTKPEDKKLREGQIRELISINGCERTLGGGEFGIDASAEYMRELAKGRLEPLFNRWADGTEAPKTIHFMMDGVSRGGVTASLGAMAINGWVAKEYPQYLKFVKFDLIQRDPVPGPSTANEKDSVRIGGATNDQELDENGFIKGTNYKPLSKASSNSTVFYALHPDVGVWSPFFQPQRVYGANRIILSPFEHADNGKIPGVFNSIFQKNNKSRAMLNNSNGEFYAGSGVSDLDDGVYILDEYSTLTKINSYEDAVKILNETRNDHIYSKRKGRILDVVKAWFDEHKEAQEGNVANGR